MGLIDASNTVIEGLIGAIIIGGLYIGMWATLISYYGNTQVFVFGAIVMILLGIIPIAYVANVIKRVMRDTEDTKETVSNIRNVFDREQ